MNSRRIMFIINLDSEEIAKKWNELVREHSGWKSINEVDDTKTVIIPNMTFEAAEVIDQWLKEKDIKRTWLMDDEPEYYKLLEES